MVSTSLEVISCLLSLREWKQTSSSSQYQFIWLLTIFRKHFEGTINKKDVYNLKKNNLLMDKKYEFSSDVLMVITHGSIKAIDSKFNTRAITSDLSKVFDKVRQEVSTQFLQLQNLWKSFLNYQGSVLGPTPYLIYINNVHKIFSDVSSISIQLIPSFIAAPPKI